MTRNATAIDATEWGLDFLRNNRFPRSVNYVRAKEMKHGWTRAGLDALKRDRRTRSDPSRMGRTLKLRRAPAVFIVALVAAMISPALPISPAYADHAHPAEQWHIVVDVEEVGLPYAPYQGTMAVQYTTYGTIPVSFAGSTDLTQVSEGGGCGAYTQTNTGSGEGVGEVLEGSSYDPLVFRLSPDQTWTALTVNPLSTYTVTQTTVWALCGSLESTSEMLPRVVPIFLPGTEAELDARAVGSTIEMSYNDGGAYSSNAVDLRISYRAIKLLTSPEDSDGDGVADQADQCPDDPGPTSDSGCPDTDGDGINDFLEGRYAGPVDTDGDGIPDFADTDSDNDGLDDLTEGFGGDKDGDGIPDFRDPEDNHPPPPVSACYGEVERRGFTRAHYDADWPLVLAKDPDFFDWEVSARWCVKDGKFRFDSVNSDGRVTVDLALGTLLGSFGVTFAHDPLTRAVAPIGSPLTGQLTATAEFDVCVEPLSLISAGSGRLIDNVADKAARQMMGKIPRSGDLAKQIDHWVLQAQNHTLNIDERLLQGLAGSLDRGLLSKLPEAMTVRMRAEVTERIGEVGLALRGQDPNRSASFFADQGYNRFLDVYYDGERITIPRGNKRAARELWLSIVDSVADGIAEQIVSVLSYEICPTVWQPSLDIYIPQVGESFVDDERVDGSVFDVTGGIVQDDR